MNHKTCIAIVMIGWYFENNLGFLYITHIWLDKFMYSQFKLTLIYGKEKVCNAVTFASVVVFGLIYLLSTILY